MEITYISKDALEKLEERFGFAEKYERLKAGEIVLIDGKHFQLSTLNVASPLK